MNFTTPSENKFVTSRSLHVWNRCCAFVLEHTVNCFLKSMQCFYCLISRLASSLFLCCCETWTEWLKWYFSGSWYYNKLWGRFKVPLLLNEYGDPYYFYFRIKVLLRWTIKRKSFNITLLSVLFERNDLKLGAVSRPAKLTPVYARSLLHY